MHLIEKLNNLIVNKPGTPVGYGAPDSGWIICAMNTQKGVTATRLKEIQGPRSQRVAQTARHSIAKWAIFLRLTTQHARGRWPAGPFLLCPNIEFACLIKTRQYIELQYYWAESRKVQTGLELHVFRREQRPLVWSLLEAKILVVNHT